MPDTPDGAAKEWVKYGQVDPYFGVLSEDRFHRENIDADAIDAFFETGRDHVRWLLGRLDQMFGVSPSRVLDFGCGAGRLTLALAETADNVVGVDVSPGMLDELRKNAERRGISNVTAFERIGDAEGDFTFVHSFIVFQHIPTKTGMRVLRELLDRVRPDGVAAVQLTTAPATRRARLYFSTSRSVPLVAKLWNLAKRRPWSYPVMQMHSYEPSAVAREFASAGFGSVRIEPHTDHTGTGFHSLWYFAQRTGG